jgi:hypothetical protein
MSSNHSFRLAVAAVVVAGSAALAYGCSSNTNDTNPAPSSHDAGGTDSTASSSSGGGSGSGSGSSSGGIGDSSGGADVPIIDTGACTSDASTCNSCYTAQQAAQDPLNACAPETLNCIPFTGTVPTHPTL